MKFQMTWGKNQSASQKANLMEQNQHDDGDVAGTN
jgi:hypothetical protein